MTLSRTPSRTPSKKSGGRPLAATCALALALAGCDEASSSQLFPEELQTRVDAREGPPAEAVVTEELVYERNEAALQRLEVAALDGQAELDPAFVAALRPDPLVRIVQVSDVQLREERARLVAFDREIGDLPGASLITPLQRATRPPLLAANSAFMWLGVVLTINELHRVAPVDLTLHTGDATDVNLRSELLRFLEVADRLETPFLLAAGNHDLLAWGVWRRDRPAYGAVLDAEVAFEDDRDAATFVANGDRLLMAPSEYREALSEVVAALGPHPPTLEAFGSRELGYDLAPTPGALYYTLQLAAPVRGVRPGVQLIVLETNRDDGSADPEVDDAQLAWLSDVLSAPATRENVVVVAGHHPLAFDHPDPLIDLLTVGELDRVRDLLLAWPNVAVYLTGHTHAPAVDELRLDDGSLGLVQLNPGAILIFPQTAALVELSLDGSDLVIDARRFGAMIAPGSALAGHVAESRAAAAADDSPGEPPFWDAYRGGKALPSFPVQ